MCASTDGSAIRTEGSLNEPASWWWSPPPVLGAQKSTQLWFRHQRCSSSPVALPNSCPKSAMIACTPDGSGGAPARFASM